MKRTSVLLALAIFVFAASRLVTAQAMPDFSGTWTFSNELTPQGDRNFAHYTTLVITQTATDMNVEGRSFQQGMPPVVYKLDGSESRSETADGVTVAKAAWQGSKLVITARRTFAGPQGDLHVDTVDIYSLDNGVMTIEKTLTTSGGKPMPNRFAYTKGEVSLARAAAGVRGGGGGDGDGVAPDYGGQRVTLGPIASCPRDPVGFDRCVKMKAKEFKPPRTADGKPDLQGYWGSAGALTGVTTGQAIEARPTSPLFNGGNSMIVDPPDGVIPYQPWALAERDVRQRPENALMDPQVHCYNAGMPRQMYIMPFLLLRTNDHLVFLHEVTHSYRIVAMDGRQHLPSAFQTWQGDSIGRWEGDTLVIETTNNNGLAYLDLAHSFLGPKVKVTERYMMVTPNMLYWTATMVEPTVFTRPWTMAAGMLRQTQKGFEIFESACHEENQDLEHLRAATDKMKAGRQ